MSRPKILDYKYIRGGPSDTSDSGSGGSSAVSSVNGQTGDVVLNSSNINAEPTITPGTTAQYWRGDKTWRDFATDVRAAVLTGLSTATSAVIAATDTVLQAFGKLQAQITDNLLPAGYIDGLKMVWVSGTALTVTSGAAFVPSLGKVLRATSDITKTGLSLTASTWYHVYLYDNAGTPDAEIVTTAPSAAYNGQARTKTGDVSRRYVGSVRTGSGATLYNFEHAGDRIFYREDVANGTLPFRVLGYGTATVDTVISCAGVVPLTASAAALRMQNASAVGGFRAKQSDGAYATAGAAAQTISPGGLGIFDLPLNSGQELVYFYNSTPSGDGGFIDVSGYTYGR